MSYKPVLGNDGLYKGTPPPDLSGFEPIGIDLHLDQTIPQIFIGGTITGSGLLKVTSGTLGLDTTTAGLAASALQSETDPLSWKRGDLTETGNYLTTGTVTGKNVTVTKTIIIDGDLKSLYAVSATKKIPYQENGAGITITSIVVQCSVADPTTELNANIMYCDAQGTGAFPGASPTLVAAIDTTTGNFDSGAVTYAIATGHPIYLLMDADPTDLLTMWTITITYTVN